MGYQTPWLTLGYEIALLKPQKACYSYPSRRIVEKPEAPFSKCESMLGSLNKPRIYNLLILCASVFG